MTCLHAVRTRLSTWALMVVLALLLPGCAVVTAVDVAASVAIGTVGLAANAVIGTARIAGNVVGATADAVLPEADTAP
jgi:hypothetical protein